MNKATEKRIAGIRAVNDATVTTDANGNTFHGTRTEIAARIREIASLGRTDRWRNAVEAWALMIEDDSQPLEWAFLQYGVYAAHAVD